MTTASVTLPDTFDFELLGVKHTINTAEINGVHLNRAVSVGISRMLAGQMGLKSKDPLDKRTSRGAELIAKLKTDQPLVSRTRNVDPVPKEVRRLANVEIDAAMPKLLAHHGVSRADFDKTYRKDYLEEHLKANGPRLEKEAKANLAKPRAEVAILKPTSEDQKAA